MLQLQGRPVSRADSPWEGRRGRQGHHSEADRGLHPRHTSSPGPETGI